MQIFCKAKLILVYVRTYSVHLLLHFFPIILLRFFLTLIRYWIIPFLAVSLHKYFLSLTPYSNATRSPLFLPLPLLLIPFKFSFTFSLHFTHRHTTLISFICFKQHITLIRSLLVNIYTNNITIYSVTLYCTYVVVYL